jgi:mono/diheme cytochrome c family protein
MRKITIFILSVTMLALSACGGGKTKSSNTKTSQKSAAVNLPGKSVYTTYCLACHQSSGSGVPAMYPPLKESDVVNGDKDHLIHILLNGLSGEITVNGKTFNSIMPTQSYLTDQQIADVLSYIRSDFGNNSGAVTPAEVAKIRGEKK